MPDIEAASAAGDRITRLRRNPEFNIALGAKIKVARFKADMTQTELGNALGVSFQQVQKYERGIDRVAASTLQKLGEVLGVHPGSFFDNLPVPVGSTAELREVMIAANALQRLRTPLVRKRILALIDELTKADTPEP